MQSRSRQECLLAPPRLCPRSRGVDTIAVPAGRLVLAEYEVDTCPTDGEHGLVAVWR